MRYLGGKSYYKKYIVPLLIKDRTEGQYYVEPFIGGGNIFSEIANPRLGADAHKYLIDMWQEVENGWTPPEKVTEEEFKHIKAFPYLYKPELVAYVGFTCSMLGKWFGTYVREHLDNRTGNTIKPSEMSYRSALKQFPKMKGAEFICSNYADLDIPDNSIIYCDPPYKNTEKYSNDIIHDEFWEWCRQKVLHGHKVFISEYEAPEDFECIWQRSRLKTSLNHPNKKIKTEKLFIWGA